MSTVSFNGRTVVRGRLFLKLTGNWSARLDSIDCDAVPAEGSACTLVWLGTLLRGYVVRSGESEGVFSAYVAGGAGGLAQDLPALGYANTVQVAEILRAILTASGEQLSTSAQVVGTVPCWPRFAGAAAAQIDALALAVGVNWRVLPDGSIWWGQESWPAGPAGDYQVERRHPARNCWQIRADALVALPGRTLAGNRVVAGNRVGDVEYRVDKGSQATVFFTAETADPVRTGIALLVEELLGVDTLALYPAQIVEQHADGTVSVQPDSRRVPPQDNVPLRGPCHGARLHVPAGSRCLLGFAGGDPLQPFAALWEPGGTGKPAARVDDTVDIGTLKITAVAPGAITGTYTAPGSTPLPFALNTEIPLKGKITSGSPHLALPAGSSV